ncbi:Septation initiation network scaffold protein cdc11 [Leucoagaricus sp. SymC.cos]|nr:Septation initiation network scaffold protein cdc11 [Leucoagaricus sp. SymC.cos]
MVAPGWQTEELQDEWVDLDPENSGEDQNNLSFGTHSLSLTVPLPSHIHTNRDLDDRNTSTNNSNASHSAAGTFLIRDDVPGTPFQPKTPGRKKGLMKDIFTPLQLERMFEPPSPPRVNLPQDAYAGAPMNDISPLPDHMAPGADIRHGGPLNVRRRSQNIGCQFTFTVPRELSLAPRPTHPQAQSTPNPPVVFRPKATDPRLRLFQFQYDTYTREHLSAMVDSIAINTPSATGTTPSPTSFTHHLSHVSELTGPASLANVSHLRSAKRVKLSPLSDYYGEDAGSQAVITRPKLTGKDYVGESKQLMQQIKSARDFSTISTTATTPHKLPSTSQANEQPTHADPVSTGPCTQSSPDSQHLGVPNDVDLDPTASSSYSGSKRSQYSSSSYREQAAMLMAQIKQSVKGQKRVFSGETEASHLASPPNSQRDMPSFTHSTPESTIVSIRCASSANGVPRQPSPGPPRTTSFRPSEGHKGSHTSSLGSQHGVHATQAQHNLVDPMSSTVGGTTVTSGSATSFVKHAGPAHIRTISPQDIPSLPDRFGDMIFDKVNSRWVRNVAGVPITNIDESSEDPFVDIESLRDDSRGARDGDGDDRSEESQEDDTARQGHYSVINEMSRIDERCEMDDEEVDLMSFSTDASSHVVSVMTGVDPNAVEDGAETTDSEDNVELIQPEMRPLEFDSEDEDFQSVDIPKVTITQEPNLASSDLNPSASQPLATPLRSNITTQTTPAIRSALKNHGTTPTSVLKDPNRIRYQTPLLQGSHRRSVSFSDGKLEGPIQDLNNANNSTTTPFSLDGTDAGGETTNEISPSARSKRIEEMMHALEDSDLSEGDSSPSKRSSGRLEELQPLSARQPDDSKDTRRVFSRSPSRRPASSKEDPSRTNGTFLTECSFGVAHDRLVTVITDVQPFEPYWEQLTCINISEKNLESVARLKEFLPRLDALNLNLNQIAWLSGVPGSVRTLSVASNSLTGLTSFNHLHNLENLDISRNDIDSLRQLECLRHLRELKADHNKIKSLDGLQDMDGLVKLSVQDNLMQSIELGAFKWKRLEMLNVSQNRLERITGVETLLSLVALNLDNNCLRTLGVDGSMPRLRILRLSGNRLRQVDVGAFTNLRTLYADNNSLTNLMKLNRLTKLENLSLRNQSGRGLNLLTRDVRDVKRLYLSGNPLQPTFISEACYNMIYLEVAACRLTALPEDMGKLTPNLRVLNLNYNFLEDTRPLEGLTRLEKLTIIGSRLRKTKPLIRLVQRMPDIVMLDFRMNPCTLGWYLPLLVKDVPGALQPSETKSSDINGKQPGGQSQDKLSSSWQELDVKFRRDLPDELYIGRLAYRGLIMRACERIRMLDGVGVSEKERTKAQKLLMGILDKNRNKEKKVREEGGTEDTRS